MFDFLSFTLSRIYIRISTPPFIIPLFLFFLDETAMTLEAYNSSQTNRFQREFNLDQNISYLIKVFYLTYVYGV